MRDNISFSFISIYSILHVSKSIIKPLRSFNIVKADLTAVFKMVLYLTNPQKKNPLRQCVRNSVSLNGSYFPSFPDLLHWLFVFLNDLLYTQRHLIVTIQL